MKVTWQEWQVPQGVARPHPVQFDHNVKAVGADRDLRAVECSECGLLRAPGEVVGGYGVAVGLWGKLQGSVAAPE